jgi:hypothetical protein
MAGKEVTNDNQLQFNLSINPYIGANYFLNFNRCHNSTPLFFAISIKAILKDQFLISKKVLYQ